MRDDLIDLDRLQFQRRRPGQFQKTFDDAFQPLQFAANDAQARPQRRAHLRGQRAQIFFEQLKLHVERTQRIANFVREPLEQARQQIAIFRRRQLRRVLAGRPAQHIFIHFP